MTGQIGVYAGTFDPIHPGHVAFALEALRVCGLDEVVFLPEHTPRRKQAVTSIVHRVALIQRAIAGSAGLRVARLVSKQCTVLDTLPELRRMFADNQLTLLVGSDVARSFPHWEGLDVLLGEVRLAIGVRAQDDPGELTALLHQLGQDHRVPINYQLISAPGASIASSHFRDGSADVSGLSPAVRAYIRQHKLYA